MNIDKAKEFINQAQENLNDALAELEEQTDSVIHVGNGEDLQAAIDSAPGGSEIRVQPGEYNSLVLKPKDGHVIIRPDTDDFNFDERINPSWAESMIKIKHNGWAAIQVDQGTDGYDLIGFQPLPWTDKYTPMVRVGSADETDPNNCPKNIVFDQCLLLANPDQGCKRGIEANCGNLIVTRSYFEDFYADVDAQGVGGWNGPGPFIVDNNYISASGENVMWGGDDPKNELMMPTRIEIRNNTLTKRQEWQDMPQAVVKNGLELKLCKSSIIENNIIEYCWTSGQVGYLIMFTPRNQNGSATWSGIKDIIFQYNVVRNAAGFLSILGRDDINPSQETVNIKIFQNLIYGIDTSQYPGSGRCVQLLDGPKNVEICHNTIHANRPNSFLALGGPNKTTLQMRHNVLYEGEYGITASDLACGKPSWDAWIEGNLEGNLISRGTDRFITYPGNNHFTDPGVDPLNDELELKPEFQFTETGCDVDEVLERTGAEL